MVVADNLSGVMTENANVPSEMEIDGQQEMPANATTLVSLFETEM
jgi:hypothetical protein